MSWRFRLGIGIGAVCLLSLAAAFFPAAVSAQVDPFQGACQGGAQGSTVCSGRNLSNDPIAGPNGIINQVTIILSIIAGIVSVIFLIWGGIKYITANGDSSSIATAKSTIIYALVGIVVAALARPLINFVLSRI